MKAGDHVRCIRRIGRLIIGQDYQITDVYGDMGQFCKVVGLEDLGYLVNRFELVKEAAVPQAAPVAPPEVPVAKLPPKPAPEPEKPKPVYSIVYGPKKEGYGTASHNGKGPVIGISGPGNYGTPCNILSWINKNYGDPLLGGFFSCSVGAIGTITEVKSAQQIPVELVDKCIQELNASFRQAFTFCSFYGYANGVGGISKSFPVLHAALLRNGWKECDRYFNKWHEGPNASPEAHGSSMIFMYYVDPLRMVK